MERTNGADLSLRTAREVADIPCRNGEDNVPGYAQGDESISRSLFLLHRGAGLYQSREAGVRNGRRYVVISSHLI